MWNRQAAALALVLSVVGCAATTPPPGSVVRLSPAGVPSAPLPSSAELSTRIRFLSLGQVVDGVPCTNETPLGQHIHVHLQILHDGVEVPVPPGIGVGRPWQVDASGFLLSGSCFAWIHVHDSTGVIHLVAPMDESFTLGQVFEVWGQPLSVAGALRYQGRIVTLVNGKEFNGDPATLTLSNLENVVLELGDPPGVPPPALYDFAALRG